MISLPSGRKIGEGEPCFIIAEVGSNWRTLDDCLESVRQAKLAGADAVKFQAFNYAALYGLREPQDEESVCREMEEAGALVFRCKPMAALSLDWFPALKAQADRVGIEFMCSAFSPELIDAVDPYVNIHKVASAECTHKRMLERLRKIGKPVILSTGAHGESDIKMAKSALLDTQLVLLYCVAAYPAHEVELERISYLSRTFGTLAGYSDHTTDVLVIPAAARLVGASVIEKHVTAIENTDTPDRGHSLTMEQFRRMVGSVRNAYRTERQGTGTLAPSPAEREMVLRHNRRLIATRDIREGERFRACVEPGIQNFGIYRSLKDETRAFHPFLIDEVDGRVAKRAVKAGDGIGPGDIDL